METAATSTMPMPIGRRSAQPIEALRAQCHEIAFTAPDNTHKIASLLSEMILNYYQDVRSQAQQSFWCALGAAIIGTGFFVYAAHQGMNSGLNEASIGLIAGALIQVISGISFYLYSKTARQFSSFHICLERTNRFLLANTLCENLKNPDKKDSLREELIKIVANAPMLTIDMADIGLQKKDESKPKTN
jgi:hypothetical protein